MRTTIKNWLLNPYDCETQFRVEGRLHKISYLGTDAYGNGRWSVHCVRDGEYVAAIKEGTELGDSYDARVFGVSEQRYGVTLEEVLQFFRINLKRR